MIASAHATVTRTDETVAADAALRPLNLLVNVPRSPLRIKESRVRCWKHKRARFMGLYPSDRRNTCFHSEKQHQSGVERLSN